MPVQALHQLLLFVVGLSIGMFAVGTPKVCSVETGHDPKNFRVSLKPTCFRILGWRKRPSESGLVSVASSSSADIPRAYQQIKLNYRFDGSHLVASMMQRVLITVFVTDGP